MVFETTGSEFLLGLFTAFRLAPLLLGPISGAIADRYDRVRMLMVACLWALLAVVVVASMASLGHAPYWAMVMAGFAIGLAQSPSQPARMSLVLELVGRKNISNANALNSMAMNMTQVIGPALGGAMISALGAPAALWVSAAWFAISVGLLWPLRTITGKARIHVEPVFQMVREGLRTVFSNRITATVLLITLAANILIWPVYQSFMPVFAKDVLDLDAAGLGWLLMSGGVGGLTGSLIIASMGDFRFKGGLFVFGTAAWGGLWALFGLSETTALSFILMGCIGLASAAFGVLQTTLMLMTTEPAMQGRALGIQELAIGSMPIASLGLGVLAQEIGVGPTAVICGTLLLIILLTLATRAPDLVRYSGD
jgi:predicted MFS family arabinose efflux permease